MITLPNRNPIIDFRLAKKNPEGSLLDHLRLICLPRKEVRKRLFALAINVAQIAVPAWRTVSTSSFPD